MKNSILTFVLIVFFFLNLSSQNNSLNFDGTDDKAVVLAPASLEVSQELTMEVWVKYVSDSEFRIILNKEGEYEIGISQGEIAYAMATTSPVWTWIYTSYIIPNNTWTHIAVTYEGTVVKVYANGVEVFSQVTSGLIGDAHPTEDDFTIGYRQRISGIEFIGNLDDVRIWNVARTATEIINNFNTELTGTEAGLIGYWKFDVPNSTCDVEDCDANENHATRIGVSGANNLPQFSTDVPSITDVACSSMVTCALVPVELAYFEAAESKGEIKLTWQTATEINNQGFEIQRSIDGLEWGYIDFVEGNGSSQEKNEYQYFDPDPQDGINYYRLKQMDYDGASEYTEVVSVQLASVDQISIYPNPTEGMLKILGIKNAQVKVVDQTGRIVRYSRILNNKLDLRGVSAGFYILEIFDEISDRFYIKKISIRS